ncbi:MULTISPECIES: BREX-2 system adenine-specific DNA-methyltransferase PglX [unclassified Saccharopolyspora]|uniref:BREX-2 system adenine-specific DNA-methyltransferase PglX n=1 Tax=unclassified Saccharopolyspora TaxID=2646250 RepID=UPI001CD638B6|nr:MULTISPECIES: BREX-2 system adenine-specific DNA-methyltransferase PglX [unclassified Saccharopolyspora]MCA1186174.1 BREX-2 system adenine-specific DNA-methyltransferase PglX [Saccharopolyspora sp. 6T]MCA1278377.1 BREX-2 system adenine-specific DNA-methyltransferase PglX [Saccharopolyspora sp. 7B]
MTETAGTEQTTRGLDLAALVKDLRTQVSALEDDLRARAGAEEFDTKLRAEYAKAREAERTAAAYQSWLDDRVTQIAAAWVLGTVFVRFCEDNGLIPDPFLAGPEERLGEAEDRHEAHFKQRPQDNDRDWIVTAFRTLAESHPTAAGLFDADHNPLWEVTPSFEAATELIRFWRRRDADGHVRYDFTDSELDTRFLGDLYQDLSANARKTFALLQTPEFVEEFILDLTLEPAVEEFGLEGLRTIDPACGSGHFLLGIFHRLLDKWRAAEPGTDRWELIRRSLESVHGCDKNPFAVSIARFRLLVAALKAADESRLDRAATFPIHVAVGDSLIHGKDVPGTQLTTDSLEHTYEPEDVYDYVRDCELLTKGSYHVVVGNPPYITVKDKQENEKYRKSADYKAICSGTYALSVPFAKRLFDLAVKAPGSERRAGYVGQITANSFMKREFGKKLIQDYFAQKIHLTHVIDTSGAYIPGHGTPTVILAGRNHFPRTDKIRAVLGIRGEPSEPDVPADGLVWSAIVDQWARPGSESEWVSAEDFDRAGFGTFPWSLSGGGAADVLAVIDKQESTLRTRIDVTGRTTHTGLDDAFYLPGSAAVTRQIARGCVPVVLGEDVRDFLIDTSVATLLPYDGLGEERDLEPGEESFVWPNRTVLRERIDFSQKPEERGLRWFDHSMFFKKRYRTPLSIAFAFVATHNHFVLDRGGKVFKQSAPVIKLPDGAGEDEHLALLGVLNSSAACFWLKQVSHDKGNRGEGGGITSAGWERFFEFTGTKLQDFPLPQQLPLELGRELDSLAQALSAVTPSSIAAESVPTRERLDAGRAGHDNIRARMIAVQEELDWTVYHSYGLLKDTELAGVRAESFDDVPEVRLGERAFEIVLARKVAAGEAETAWFDRHGSTPITEIPAHWPSWYRDIVQNRIDVIEKRRDIALIERPECKRRWSETPWDKREAEALETWLLDRCERRDLWFALRERIEQPRTLTIHQLADAVGRDADMRSVASLYARDHLGKPDLPLAQVLDKVVANQHVPYLAAFRYKDSGLRKRAQWEDVWALQRKEDATGERLDIPVPPKYTSSDFRKGSYWAQRGKLDVPKERFVSYPDASPGADGSLLLGWAGWDHRDQAQALVNLVNDRTDESWTSEQLTPLLAGLAELMPWIHQWHGEHDEEWGGNPAQEYQAFLEEHRTRHQLTDDDLTAWLPATGRRSKQGDQQ